MGLTGGLDGGRGVGVAGGINGSRGVAVAGRPWVTMTLDREMGWVDRGK